VTVRGRKGGKRAFEQYLGQEEARLVRAER
jgi:hypothetical protein